MHGRFFLPVDDELYDGTGNLNRAFGLLEEALDLYFRGGTANEILPSGWRGGGLSLDGEACPFGRWSKAIAWLMSCTIVSWRFST